MSTDELGDRADRATYTEPPEWPQMPPAAPGWADAVADWTFSEIMNGSAALALGYVIGALLAKLIVRSLRSG